jgi:hypothetical protein
MSDKLATRKNKTLIVTGKGKDKQVLAPQLKISSRGKIQGFGNKVDIVFVFDTTGSMDNKIEALLLTCKEFVDEAKSFDLDAHFALVSFGDISIAGGGDTIDLVVPLTGNIEKIKKGLTNIPRNNGFGNEGESCLEAILKAFRIRHRKNAVKVMVIITDEPALQHEISTDMVIKQMRKNEYLVFVVAIDMPYYKEMALKNGGTWKQIGMNTNLGDILKVFKEMAKKVSSIAQEVHLLGKGSVSKYLALKDPDS